MSTTPKIQYDDIATSYLTMSHLPCAMLETQLITKALNPCTNLQILDLGGSSGKYARTAINLGATNVDVVDISKEMIQTGQTIDTNNIHHSNQIKYYKADISLPLPNQLPPQITPGTYDIIMANWLFEQAHSITDLEIMWSNIATYIKRPDGRLIITRTANVENGVKHGEKYGSKLEDMRKFNGGCIFWIVMKCRTSHSSSSVEMMEEGEGSSQVEGNKEEEENETEIRFESVVMDVTASGSEELYRKYGFQNVNVLDCEEMDIVKRDSGFWREFVEEPLFVTVIARSVLQ